MSLDVKNKVILGILVFCFTVICPNIRLSAQAGQGSRFDGIWLGESYDFKYFAAIKGNEITIQAEKSGFDEWVSFLDEKNLNVAKGIIKISGNYIKMTLTHIWGNLWAFLDEDLYGNFDYWQTPKDFFEKYGESWDEYQKDSPELFFASGVISGNRMRLKFNGETQIITKQ